MAAGVDSSVNEELDDWLPRPAVRVAHQQTSSASVARLWRAACDLRLEESPLLSRLIQWRIPGVPHDLPFERLFREPPFMVLAEHEHALVSGLVGRIWTLRRDYPRLPDPNAFRTWGERGTARVLICNWVTDDPSGAMLHSEARVQALGTQGQIGLAAIRPVVAAFQHLIGTETHGAAIRHAEQGGDSEVAGGSTVME